MDKSNKPKMKTKIESYTYINRVLIEHFLEEEEKAMAEWKVLSEAPIYKGLLNNLGIGVMSPMYIEVSEIQNKNDEYNKIVKFLNRYLEYYAKSNQLSVEDLKLEFINYGKTELVYVLTDKNGGTYTLLVKQPYVKMGDVYQEMQYLLELKEQEKNIVAPIDYFQLGEQELYVTPYIYQARCIASYGTWGMYIPEPYYRFESFTQEQEKIVNTCMIAKLVSLYDFDKEEGLSCCKLGGGDFMLPKGWETTTPTIDDTLSQLYLIAARRKVKCSFDEYLNIIRGEFSRVTITEDENNLIINKRGRVAMQIEEIDDGIKLGMSLVNNRKGLNLLKDINKN